jgi:hypothetical protein
MVTFCRPKKLAEAEAFLALIREAPDSNLGRKTDYADSGLFVVLFSQSTTNAMVVP